MSRSISPPSASSESDDDASTLESLPSEMIIEISSDEEGEEESSTSTRTSHSHSRSRKPIHRTARQLLSENSSESQYSSYESDDEEEEGSQVKRDAQEDSDTLPSSDESDDEDTDTMTGFRFVEGRDWEYDKYEDEVQIFQPGLDKLMMLTANRSFRFRTAKTDYERSFGIMDRIRIDYIKPNKRRVQKQEILTEAILKEVRYNIRKINWDSQNLAWNRYAVKWCFSEEGLTWMNKLNKTYWYGNQTEIKGHPPLNWREDLSDKTQKLWTSVRAIEDVLENILPSVKLTDVIKDGEPYGVWGEVAQIQTFRLIRQQCGVIFLLMRERVPKTAEAIDDYIVMYKRMKQGRPAKLSFEFFRELDERISAIVEEHGQPHYSFPVLRVA